MNDTDSGKVSDGIHGKLDPRSWHPILSIVLGSILGSGGSLGVIFSTPLGQELARPNPYTSVQAESEHKQFDIRIKAAERHIYDHPDTELRAAIAAVIADVAAGKSERTLIIANQNRILDRLDRMKN